MPTEADTCRTHLLRALYAPGWTDDQIRGQLSCTPGRTIVAGGKVRRGRRQGVDLLSEAAFPIGVGLGFDAGEAVPTQGGYRTAALNLSALGTSLPLCLW